MSEVLYCRLCAELTPKLSLATINNESTVENLKKKLFHFFQIQIEESDKLPKDICATCCEQVEVVFEFSEKVKKAQDTLRSIFIDRKDIKVEWNEENENENHLSENVKLENTDDEFNFGSFDDNKFEISDNEDVMLSERLHLAKQKRRKVKLKKTDTESDNSETRNDDLNKSSTLKAILEEWKNYKWQCSLCPVELSSVKELREHFQSVHEKPPQYICSECSKIYDKYDLFKRHVRAHRNKHKYRCNVCGKFSYNKSLHEQHIVRHSTVCSFMCSTCGKSFKTKSSLYIHSRLHLPEEQKSVHICDICNKRFSSAPNLKSHKRIHLGIKQYTCDQCGRNFTQKVNLDHHIISKHTDENPCHCTQCPKVFKNIFRLRRHQVIHTDVKPYGCDVCDKKYRRGSDLRNHRRIHSGELPYQCEHCKRRFRMKKFLEVHIRQHTGERPYSCLECNHHFANSSNYIKHMKAKHGVMSFKNLTNVSQAQQKQQYFNFSKIQQS